MIMSRTAAVNKQYFCHVARSGGEGSGEGNADLPLRVSASPQSSNPRRHNGACAALSTAGRLVGELMKRISLEIDFKAFADPLPRRRTEKKLVY